MVEVLFTTASSLSFLLHLYVLLRCVDSGEIIGASPKVTPICVALSLAKLVHITLIHRIVMVVLEGFTSTATPAHANLRLRSLELESLFSFDSLL